MTSHELAKKLLALPDQPVTYEGAIGGDEGYSMKLGDSPDGGLILYQELKPEHQKDFKDWLQKSTEIVWITDPGAVDTEPRSKVCASMLAGTVAKDA